MSGQLHTAAALLSLEEIPAPSGDFKRREFLSLEGKESQLLACLTRSLVMTQTKTNRMSVFVT